LVRIDKRLVRLRFERSLPSYSEHALVQREMAERLLRALAARGRRRFPRVLEFGCGSGLLTERLAAAFDYDSLVINDLVEECESLAGGIPRSVFLPGDIESITVPDRLDLVVSNAVVQWLDDLPDVLERLRAKMNPGAVLAFSTFGPENLRETARLSGAGLAYRSIDQLKRVVGERFRVRLAEETIRRLYFDSPQDVLHHLRRTGVTGLSGRRWTSAVLRDFYANYDRLFRDANGVSLTYHPIIMVAETTS